MDAKQQLYAWLNDAHATEVALEKILVNHVADATEFPEVRDRLQEHLGETRRHAQMLRDCIESTGGKLSTVKSLLGSVVGRVEAVGTGMFADQIIKNMLMDAAAERFETASYRSLIAAAEEMGEQHIASVCREILAEDEAMAKWLDTQVAQVTREFLQRYATAV